LSPLIKPQQLHFVLLPMFKTDHVLDNKHLLPNQTTTPLQFIRFQTAIDIVFWPLVAKLKLEVVGLVKPDASQRENQAIELTGSYTYLTRKIPIDGGKERSVGDSHYHLPPLFSLNEKSFPEEGLLDSGDAILNKEAEAVAANLFVVKIPGTLIFFDREKDLIDADRKGIFSRLSEKVS
ncbi:hypothetical protein L0F63_004111, partial [Massospora cicadina]